MFEEEREEEAEGTNDPEPHVGDEMEPEGAGHDMLEEEPGHEGNEEAVTPPVPAPLEQPAAIEKPASEISESEVKTPEPGLKPQLLLRQDSGPKPNPPGLTRREELLAMLAELKRLGCTGFSCVQTLCPLILNVMWFNGAACKPRKAKQTMHQENKLYPKGL